jgi:hypothetical protein
MSNKTQDKGCTLSDQKLIDSCREWISKLCDSGGKEWTLGVPVDFNRDPDMLFSEVITRFKSATEENEELRVKTRFLGELIDRDIAASAPPQADIDAGLCPTPSKGRGILKWVKASDQMPPTPDDKKRLHINYKGRPNILIYLNGIWCWLDDTDFNSSDYPVHDDSWSAIEWLDESCQADSGVTPAVEKETNFLLHLVDVAWKAATQSEEVPDTGWAIALIAEAKNSIPIKSRKNHMGYSEEAVLEWLSSLQAYKEKGEQ